MNKNSESNSFQIKVDVKQTLYIGLGFMSAMIAWSFYNFKIPIILNGIDDVRIGLLGSAPEMEVFGAFIMTLDNIIAVLLQPYFGEISDRMQSKYGRRTPFFIIGLPISAFCLIIIPFFPLIGAFLGIVLAFNIAMAFYRPAIISIMPDKTPKQVISTANALVSLMGGIGTVFGLIVPYLVGLIPGANPPEPVTPQPIEYFFMQDFWGFLLTGLFMFICMILFLGKVREVPTGKTFFKVGNESIDVDIFTHEVNFIEENDEDAIKEPKFLKHMKDIAKDEDKSAFWILLTIFSYLFGYNALLYSFGRFATSYIGISEGTAGALLAILPVVLIVFAIFIGKWAEKYGRLLIMKIGLLILMAISVGAIFILEQLRDIFEQTGNISIIDLIPLVIVLSFGGLGYGFAHINALPVVWQLSPKEHIGSYTGIYYFFSSLSAILSPLLMGNIFSIIRALGGNQWISFFPYFLVWVTIGFILIHKVKKGDRENLSAEELKKLKSEYISDD